MREMGAVLTMGASLREQRWLEAWDARCARSMIIGFDRPVSTLAVSVTGLACALRCAHCNGHYLAGMHSLDDPALQRARSLLISGGCDARGRVPVLSHLPRIAALASGRRLNWHVGLIDEETMKAIQPYADVISFDLPGDDQTIREVYGIEQTVEDYLSTYRMLRRYAPVVPHITVGLRGGELGGERRALGLLSDLGAQALVFIVFIPTPGTRYENRQPTAVEKVADLLAEARLLFRDTPILLGCMRPSGRYRDCLDALAVRVGVDKIVNPARTAVAAAAELGLVVEWGEECCVL